MNNNPLISIIMSCYNEKIGWIDKAVKSILNQTYKNFEYIIVIDSPENKKISSYLTSIKDDRIKLVFNEKNVGLVESLNKAIDLAQGEYIARMDSDDISENNRIEKQVNYLINNRDIALIATNMRYIDENDDEILIANKNFQVGFNKIKRRLKYENVMSHPTFMAKRQVICDEKINKYRNVFSSEDYDLICRLVRNGYKIENIDEKLLRYRIRQNSITRSNELLQFKVASYIQKLYRNNSLDNIDYEYIDKLRRDKSGQKWYNVSNNIKEKYKNFRGIKKTIIYIIANCISYYSLKKMIKKVFCYIDMVF